MLDATEKVAGPRYFFTSYKLPALYDKYCGPFESQPCKKVVKLKSFGMHEQEIEILPGRWHVKVRQSDEFIFVTYRSCS